MIPVGLLVTLPPPFGISTAICDNEHPILIVDPLKQQVSLGSASVPPVPYGEAWTIEQFCGLPIKEGWPDEQS